MKNNKKTFLVIFTFIVLIAIILMVMFLKKVLATNNIKVISIYAIIMMILVAIFCFISFWQIFIILKDVNNSINETNIELNKKILSMQKLNKNDSNEDNNTND